MDVACGPTAGPHRASASASFKVRAEGHLPLRLEHVTLSQSQPVDILCTRV
jgi:hypothetical protein